MARGLLQPAISSIAHAGYMLMGVVELSNDGLATIMLYFVVYLFMNLGAFYIVVLIANQTGSEDIEDYKGLGQRAPFITVALAVFLVSLTGLPPTAGFIGKLYFFAALLNHGWVWLAVVGAPNSVISLYYYVRIFLNMYLRSSEHQQVSPLNFTVMQKATVLVLLVPTLLLGLYFGPLVGAILVETVFSWPGMGRLMFDGILRRDYPLIMGILIFSSVMVIVNNLITDILYGVLDPRISRK